jgi:putative ABC transport system substrate-binding protein
LDVGTPDTAEEISRQAEPLRALGWIEGRTLHVERRYADYPQKLPLLAEELVRARLELIVTFSSAATLAAMKATTTIPIIFGSAADPVALGLVASLSKPGGNVTGFSLIASELTAKRLSILKEVVPDLQRLAFLWERDNPIFRFDRERVAKGCRAAGVEAIFADYGGPAEISSAAAVDTSDSTSAAFDDRLTFETGYSTVGGRNAS